MGGHSHWATIKRHKGAQDAKRGKIFTRIIRELTIAARSGGDPDGNPRLRLAIAKAKEANMPGDTMKKAVQRGTGELPGVNYEEFSLEGYGPGGTAVLLEITSDNRNRTVAEIRSLLTKNHGNMSEAGAVAWQFQKKGLVAIEKGKVDEDALLSLALDAGAEDVKVGEKVMRSSRLHKILRRSRKRWWMPISTQLWPRSPSFRRTRSAWTKSPLNKCSS